MSTSNQGLMWTADTGYLHLLKMAIHQKSKPDRTGVGRRTVVGPSFRIDMSNAEFPLLTIKQMAWTPIVVELLWFLKGSTNIKYLNENGCKIWNEDAYKAYLKYAAEHPLDGDVHNLIQSPDGGSVVSHVLNMDEFIAKVLQSTRFATKFGTLGPIYGYQWRNLKIDQIEYVIQMLKQSRYDSGILVNSWNAEQLMHMTLRPCHFAFQFVCTPDGNSDVLNLIWYQRSADAILGVPFNIASYALLLRMMCQIFNMQPGILAGHFGDFHIYDNHIEAAEEILGRTPKVPPQLEFSDAFKSNCRDLFDDNISVTEWAFNISPNDFIIKNYEHCGRVTAPLNV